jgi:hypothetical protein
VQVSALVLLVIAGTLNYVDRAALSIANPLIREELGLSIANMGHLGIVRKTACWIGGVRRRLRVWLRSPIAGVVFHRSSSSTPCQG